MKLNQNEQKILYDIGYTPKDIEQIKHLRYKGTLYCKDGTKKQINLKEIKQLLPIDRFLSGIGRAAFHRTSYREINSKKHIIIESNLFN